jgi:hypothetical protein
MALVIILLLVLADIACATERGLELVGTFQSLCMQGSLTFEAVDAKATAMQFPINKDERVPTSGRLRFRSKSWLASLDHGRYRLSAGVTQSPDSATVSCAIEALDVDGDEVRLHLVSALQLGTPYLDMPATNGNPRVTAWTPSADATLWLSNGTPGNPAVVVLLVRSLYHAH